MRTLGSISILLWISLAAAPAAATPYYDYGAGTPQRIGQGWFPHLGDGEAAWHLSDGHDDEIYYWKDGEGVRKISNNGHSDWSAWVDDGQVAWIARREDLDGGYEVWHWDGTGAPVQVPTVGRGYKRDVRLHDGTLAWTDTPAGANEAVFYRDANGMQTVVNDWRAMYARDVNDGRVSVWQRWANKLFIWENGVLTEVAGPGVVGGSLDASRMAFVDGDGAASEIRITDGVTQQRLTHNWFPDGAPVIDGGRVAWIQDWLMRNVRVWQDGASMMVARDPNLASVHIADDWLLWWAPDGATWDLAIWAVQGVPVARPPRFVFDPIFQICGGTLVGLGSYHELDLGGEFLDLIDVAVPPSFLAKSTDGLAFFGVDENGDLVLSLPDRPGQGETFADLFPGWTPEALLADPEAFFSDPTVRALYTAWMSSGKAAPTGLRVYRFDGSSGVATLVGKGMINVPEASTALLVLAGLGLLMIVRRR